MGTNHISGMVEARVIRFCTQEGSVKSQQKGAWLGSRDPFKFSGPSDIFGMADARIVKLCVQVDYVKSWLMGDKPPIKRA